MNRRDSDQSQARQDQADKKAPKLGRDVQAEIGKALRDMYDDVVKQGVPDRFNDLLANLDEQQGSDHKTPSE